MRHVEGSSASLSSSLTPFIHPITTRGSSSKPGISNARSSSSSGAVDLNPRNVVGYKGLAQSADLAGDNTRLERAQSMLDFLEVR